jgi:hypothetical protein
MMQIFLISEHKKSPRSFNYGFFSSRRGFISSSAMMQRVTMSPLTRYLSRLLGVFLLVTAASEWTQPGLLTAVAPAMVDQPALLWVSGMLTFASGLAIVLGHNVWGDPTAAVVSLLGWVMTIKGPRYCWFRPLVGRRCSGPCTIRRIPAFTRSFRRWRELI